MYKPINQANRRGWLAKEIRYGTQICFMNEISGITANFTGFMRLIVFQGNWLLLFQPDSWVKEKIRWIGPSLLEIDNQAATDPLLTMKAKDRYWTCQERKAAHLS